MANFRPIITGIVFLSVIIALVSSSAAMALTDDERIDQYWKRRAFHNFSKCLFFGVTEGKYESQESHIPADLFVNTCSTETVKEFFSRVRGVKDPKGKDVIGLFESLGYERKLGKDQDGNTIIHWEHALMKGVTPESIKGKEASKRLEIQRAVIAKLAANYGLKTEKKKTPVGGAEVLEIVFIDSPDLERGKLLAEFVNNEGGRCKHTYDNKELVGDVTKTPAPGSDLAYQLQKVDRTRWDGKRYFVMLQADGKKLLYRSGGDDYCIDKLATEISDNAERLAIFANTPDEEEAVKKLTGITCGGGISGRPLDVCIEKVKKNWKECAIPKTVPSGPHAGKLIPVTSASIAACLQTKYPEFKDQISEEFVAGIPKPKPGEADGGTDGSDGPACALEGGFGWLVCPAMTLLASLSDAAYVLVSELLEVKPELLNNDSTAGDTPTYTAWGVFRNIANVAFIVIFLIVIISQVSNTGISNYGIKRIMPRLIVGAILINASFLISQLAVDLSNITGSTLKQVLESAGAGAIKMTPEASWSTIVATTLAGTLTLAIAGAAAIYALIAIGLPGLLLFLIAIVTTLLVLIGRQAGVVLLVTISPLAFASWILPNTEQWFKRWRQALTGLLLVFPSVALLFGAGSLASKVLSSNAGNNALMQFAALIVAALPLIATPSLLRGSMNALGTIGAKFSSLGSPTMSSLKKKSGQLASEKMANHGARVRNKFMNADFGKPKTGGVIKRMGRFGQNVLRRSDRVKRDRQLQTDLLQSDREQQYKQGLMADHAAGNLSQRFGSAVDTAAGKGMLEKLRGEAIGNVEATLKSSSISELKDVLRQALASKESTTAIAAQNQLLKRGSAGISSFEDTMLDYERGGGALSGQIRQDLATNIQDSHAGVMDKNLAVGQWAIGSSSMADSQTIAHDNLAANGMTIEKFNNLTERSQLEVLTSGKAILSAGQLNSLASPQGVMVEKVSPAVSKAAGGAPPRP